MALLARLGLRNRRRGPVAAVVGLVTVAVIAAVPAVAAVVSDSVTRNGKILTEISSTNQPVGIGWTRRWTAGPRPVTDAGGHQWEPDAGVVKAGSTVHPAPGGTKNAVPYRYARAGTPAFALPVPAPGTYAVVLSFAAPNAGNAPEAEISVALDGGVSRKLRLAAGGGQVRHVVVLVPVAGDAANLTVASETGVSGVSAVTAAMAKTDVEAPKAEFAEEFDGAAGTSILPRWRHQQGANGWGNGELQDYTDRPENGALTGDGRLALTARSDGGKYTSARLRTVFQAQYGRIEAVVRVPSGAGLLPAFWMLGADVDKQGWPQAGEVDIMESLGDAEPGQVHGTAHGPDGSVRGWERGWTAKPVGGPAKDFHQYGLEWWPGILEWTVDGTVAGTLRAEDLSGKDRWVFDQPAFLLLNLAVGGRWPGNPPAATTFPQTMLVDAVHWWR